MPDYAIYGGSLRSTLEFPELAPAAGSQPTWTLRLADGQPREELGTPLGEDAVTGDVRVRAFLRPDGVALVYDDTGRFEIARTGGNVTWYGASEARHEAARADVIGRVLPMALHLSGVLTLHASAVVVGNEAIAFVAPKYHGKSSLAMALLRRGARLLTDDVLPVEPDNPPRARAGVHALRLWRDSAAHLVRAGDSTQVTSDSKLVLGSFDLESLQHDSVELGAVYVLTPVLEPSDEEPASRRVLSQVEGTTALLRHSRLGPLLSGEEAGLLFSQVATLASRTPIHELRVTRALDRLPDVAGCVVRWHSA